MYRFQFSMIKRANTRSMQYSLRSTIQALEELGLKYEESRASMIIHTEIIEAPTREQAIEIRQRVEKRLRAIHPNFAYVMDIIEQPTTPTRKLT